MEKILLVDDDENMTFFLSEFLTEKGYEVETAQTGESALEIIKKTSPDIIILDIRLPGMDGITILREIMKIDKDALVIMATAYGDVKEAVTAMKLGAFHYVTKPFLNDEINILIEKALRNRNLNREVESLRKQIAEKNKPEKVTGESPKIKQVIEQARMVAPTDMTVILQGESGTGKEVIAGFILENSPRKDKPFVALDCGAIPDTLVESELFGYEKGAFTGANTVKEGAFERANGGTLFLDEITNLPLDAQAKLLRAVQQKEVRHLGGTSSIGVDVRLIIATNADLAEAVRERKFRQDLYHRLNEFSIVLPLLKERKEDIPVLAMEFLNEANEKLNKEVRGFSGPAMEALLDYSWPGNVRELKNAVTRAVLLAESDTIERDDFPPEVTGKSSGLFGIEDTEDVFNLYDSGLSLLEISKKVSEEAERKLIEKVLIETKNNKSETARLLGIDRKSLYSKLKSLEIQ
ncbi:DNA-binding response regulator [bacterium]|nr:MAG: DNA-binding response regulator [bacterium]